MESISHVHLGINMKESFHSFLHTVQKVHFRIQWAASWFLLTFDVCKTLSKIPFYFPKSEVNTALSISRYMLYILYKNWNSQSFVTISYSLSLSLTRTHVYIYASRFLNHLSERSIKQRKTNQLRLRLELYFSNFMDFMDAWWLTTMMNWKIKQMPSASSV